MTHHSAWQKSWAFIECSSLPSTWHLFKHLKAAYLFLWSSLFPATKLQIKGMELKAKAREGEGGWEITRSVFPKVLALTGGEKDYF